MLANQSLPRMEGQMEANPKHLGQPSVVESRFGTLEVHPEGVLNLPSGLLGFGDHHDFGLAALPNGQHPHFKVLQSLDDPDLAFLVAPLNLESNTIEASDLEDACAYLGICRDNLAVLLIVTVRRDGNSAQISLNMRAPLFVDAERRLARQYVLPNNKYAIRHAL
jgi:flagellar assembly factor FliW